MAQLMKHSGTLAVGFLMRPCCAIPAALALLGLGGAGVAAALAPFRPSFLLLAVVTFSVSFYLNFIRNRNRAGMFVWTFSALVAGALLAGPELWAEVRSSGEPGQETVAMSTGLESVNLHVKGMACNACARRLERVLAEMPGVSQASIKFEIKQARVSYDARKVRREQIADRIRKAGFEVEPPSSAPSTTVAR